MPSFRCKNVKNKVYYNLGVFINAAQLRGVVRVS